MVDSPLLLVQKFIKETEGNAFILPKYNRFQSEYVSPHDELLAWLTSFTGSAGLLIIFLHRAVLFVDQRYTVQAKKETKHLGIEIELYSRDNLKQAINSFSEGKIFYDPWLHSVKQITFLQELIQEKGNVLVPLEGNPIGKFWENRPKKISNPIVPHPLKWSGEESNQKIKKVLKSFPEEADYLLLFSPESISWLLNIRGSDIPCVPVPSLYGLLHRSGLINVFTEVDDSIDPITKTYCGEHVVWNKEECIFDHLKSLSNACIAFDPAEVPDKIFKSVVGKSIVIKNPCILFKAIKNPIEIEGAKQAQLKDGIAFTIFLQWLYEKLEEKALIAELDACDYLLRVRAQQENFFSFSFPPISASGPHGAIIHYHPTEKNQRCLNNNELYLIDSGAHYREGTTDTTRIIAFTSPTLEQKKRYTAVLKGHIALASAVFPEGTDGAHLDVLARQYLWKEGLDYQHGTGHGVGSFLNVHEGPQGIGRRFLGESLKAGMILSNEPGYYKEDYYGIRIENLVVVQPHPHYEGFLCFETITLVPLERKLIEINDLTPMEKEWVNQYHEKIKRLLSPNLSGKPLEWLNQATQPLS